jgi:hypothetical protein
MNGDDIILGLIRDISANQAKLFDELSSIKSCIVGQANCIKFMSEHDTRLRAVEAICATFVATKDSNVDGEELLKAKAEAIKESQAWMQDFNTRLQSIEEKINALMVTINTLLNIINALWNSTILRAGLAAIFISLVGVMFGRGFELSQMYGIRSVAIGSGVFLAVLILLYLSRRKGKAALKQMGIIHVLLFLLLLSPCLADNVNQTEDHPIILDPIQMQTAGNQLFGTWQTAQDQDLWQMEAYAFLSNNWTWQGQGNITAVYFA